MSDIVERLLAFAYRTDIDALEATDDLMMDAADIIKRQREALRIAKNELRLIRTTPQASSFEVAGYALAAIDAVLGDGK